MARKKIYYPKSHIITNLYTKGKEWMLESGEEYIGYYHKYIDQSVYTEAVYNRADSKKLIPYQDKFQQPENAIYSGLKKRLNYKTPYPITTTPTLDDYQKGKFTRYFLRRRNYSIYSDIIEIDENQFKLWRNPNGGIDESIYNAIAIDWKLTGPLNDIRQSESDIIYGVYDTNKRIVELRDNTFPGIINVLTDYIEYSIHSRATSNEIKRLFG
jgi:hypothetical protein